MNKTWFVTGASRGLGLEIARAALYAGENVIASARVVDDVMDALAGHEGTGRLLVVALDVAEASRTVEAAAAAIEQFGSIDVLVNNAGYGQLGFFETLTAEQLERQYTTNVFGLFNVTRAVLPHMRARRAGHIFNISSIGGALGFGGACAYTSSKFAVEGFSEDMAIDLKPYGIHVTIIEPGFFRTDFLDAKSIHYGTVEIGDYREREVEQRALYCEYSHKQLGDPKKLAQVLLKVAELDEPPLRLVLGSDAIQMTRDMLAKRLAELDRWLSLSRSTDHDDATATR